MISDRCARYPYEVLVFYLVVSIGLWSLPNATGRIYLADLKPENDQEFGSMIVVARCLAVLHIFYQTKKLKLFKSGLLLVFQYCGCGDKIWSKTKIFIEYSVIRTIWTNRDNMPFLENLR